jgi:hypothetical protein
MDNIKVFIINIKYDITEMLNNVNLNYNTTKTSQILEYLELTNHLKITHVKNDLIKCGEIIMRKCNPAYNLYIGQVLQIIDVFQFKSSTHEDFILVKTR